MSLLCRRRGVHIITASIYTIFSRSLIQVPKVSAFILFRQATRNQMVLSSNTATPSFTTSCASSATEANPLLSDWSKNPFHTPPFSSIEPKYFPEALENGMSAHVNDLKNIVDDTSDPDFENTIAKYDRVGMLLDRVSSVFSNLCSSKNTDDLQPIQLKMMPILSRHNSETYHLPGLFLKIDQVYQKRLDSGLTPEQIRLTERIHMDFTRAGAALSPELQKELTDIKAELSTLQTEFTQNVMKDEEIWELILSKEDLVGCPESLVSAARSAAEEKGKADGEYVITLGRSLVEPFLTYSDRRDLRETAFKAWSSRGELDPDRDNLKLATKILKLRKRVAEIHGYTTFAAYQCADRMAQKPENVMELLENVWKRARDAANEELQSMEEYVTECGIELEGGLQAYDWRYIAEKVRKAKYDFDESLLKPYLSLDAVREAMFAVSNNLFGLKYVKDTELEAYHPDVECFKVYETLPDGSDRLVCLFLHDNFARSYKNGGAWMSEFRSQTKNLGGLDEMEGIPIVVNNNNLAKSSPTLLSYDDATTFFHEFGHAHHGMLSDATYSRLASTNVMHDFVELPSQLMENWFDQRDILKKYARHYETGEPVPDVLLDKMKAARFFQQGFQTVEYTICALLDMGLHQLDNYDDGFDISAYEKAELERLGMPRGIVMRHRPAHFQHLFSTSSYAAGYYVYQWAEVLDADAFAAFEESGNVFDKDTADKARKFIYGAGNTEAPEELFRKFRGRDPKIDFMLKRKGLLVEDKK